MQFAPWPAAEMRPLGDKRVLDIGNHSYDTRIILRRSGPSQADAVARDEDVRLKS